MLPVISLPKFNTVLPVSKKKVSFRPFTVREEKILLLAKETAVPAELVGSILQVVDNCTFGELNLNELPIVDLEYLFLQVRIKSVGEISELRYTCLNKVDGDKCGGKIDINLDLTTITASKSELSNKINITDKIGVAFKYPTVDDSVAIISSLIDKETQNDTAFLYQILDFVWEGDEIFPKNETSLEEFNTFIDGLTNEQFKFISDFVDAIPSLKQTIPTKCPKCGHESKLELEGITDFF